MFMLDTFKLCVLLWSPFFIINISTFHIGAAQNTFNLNLLSLLYWILFVYIFQLLHFGFDWICEVILFSFVCIAFILYFSETYLGKGCLISVLDLLGTSSFNVAFSWYCICVFVWIECNKFDMIWWKTWEQCSFRRLYVLNI